MHKLFALSLFLSCSGSLACEGFLAPNNLLLPPSDKNEGLSELEYEEVISKVERIYSPVARENNAVLKLQRQWASPTVNAGTYRDERNKQWLVNLYGGLARHPFMTLDGYALVICHEIGHHLGGAPKKTLEARPFWPSSEGQADYWATLKCLRRIFKREDNLEAIKDLVIPAIVTKECENSFTNKNLSTLCIRIALAGQAVSKISAGVRATANPEFETPDLSIVAQNFEKHPLPQCRLDSYFQGALCPQVVEDAVSQEDARKGTCHPENGFQTGLRPLCWYRP